MAEKENEIKLLNNKLIPKHKYTFITTLFPSLEMLKM